MGARQAAPRATANYRGLRITLTQAPGGDYAYASVSVKQPGGHWDDWSLLFPAVRTDAPSVTGTADVLRFLAHTLRQLADQADEGAR